jgi:sterol desaturase/sphingolipid hydroxylase (fatty acid hydroxylase superfamily)
MHQILDLFYNMTLPQAAWWLLVENVVLFGLSLAAGHLLLRLFAARRVTDPPPPLERREVLLAASCVLLNTLVTIAGWWLWTNGVMRIRRDTGLRAWLDVLVLLLAMDLFMYLFHRAAHHRWVYPVAHATHHLYDRPRPLNLFVLNPIEVLGFGALWLTVIALYPSSWLGIVVFLTLNLAFGTVGHLGVEPLPTRWMRLPILRHVGTSTFHAEHHDDGKHNFGFYTDLWDRLFGTVDPRYERGFGGPAATARGDGASPPASAAHR